MKDISEQVRSLISFCEHNCCYLPTSDAVLIDTKYIIRRLLFDIYDTNVIRTNETEIVWSHL